MRPAFFGALLAAVSACVVTPGSVRASSDACAMISTGDVGRALGAQITSTKRAAFAGAAAVTTRGCTYKTANVFSFVVITATKSLPGGGTFAYKRNLDQTSAAYGAKPVPIAGVGDEAASVTKFVLVRKNATIFTIDAIAAGGPEHAIAIARSIGKMIHD